LEAPKFLREETVLSQYGKWVKKKTYQLPNGSEIEYIVWGGKSPIMIFAITDDNMVVAITQFRFGAEEVILEVAGGCLEAGRSPEDTVRDELLEETGYQARNIRKLTASPLFFEPAACPTTYEVFLAEGCVKVAEPTPSPDECLEVKVIPIQEWINLIFQGIVRDSKTIAVTMLALPHLGYELT